MARPDDYPARTKAWLVAGYLVATGLGWWLASANRWTGLTSGPRPMIIVLVGVPYWGLAMFTHDVLVPFFRDDPPHPPARPEFPPPFDDPPPDR